MRLPHLDDGQHADEKRHNMTVQTLAIQVLATTAAVAVAGFALAGLSRSVTARPEALLKE